MRCEPRCKRFCFVSRVSATHFSSVSTNVAQNFSSVGAEGTVESIRTRHSSIFSQSLDEEVFSFDFSKSFTAKFWDFFNCISAFFDEATKAAGTSFGPALELCSSCSLFPACLTTRNPNNLKRRISFYLDPWTILCRAGCRNKLS